MFGCGVVPEIHFSVGYFKAGTSFFTAYQTFKSKIYMYICILYMKIAQQLNQSVNKHTRSVTNIQKVNKYDHRSLGQIRML